MKNETELELALSEAVTAATQAGDLIVEWSRQAKYEVRQKQGTELLTTADLRSDEIIRERLGSRFPQHRFLSEEVVVEGNFDFSGPVWIIDPIDGTANYAHGHPYVSISVALTLDGAPCLGVVHAPFLHETYAAILGAGATCNGRPVRVSEVSELRHALIGTGFPHLKSVPPPPLNMNSRNLFAPSRPEVSTASAMRPVRPALVALSKGRSTRSYLDNLGASVYLHPR